MARRITHHSFSSRDLWNTFLHDWWGVLKGTYNDSSDHNIGLIGAGAAFYTFSSIAPILAAAVLTYGLVADPETVRANIVALFQTFPRDAARLIAEQLDTVATGSSGKKGLGLIIALVLAIYGGSKAATSMMTALNVAFGVKDKRNIVVSYLTAFGIVGAGVILMLLGAVTGTVMGFLGNLIPWLPGFVRGAIGASSYLLLAALVVTGASLLFRFGPYRPRARVRWGTPGAVLASVLWIAASLGFGLYASNFGNYGATYGSLSAIIVLLTWLWISIYAFLMGAELDAGLLTRVHDAKKATVEDAPVAAPKPAARHRPARAKLQQEGPVKGAALSALGLVLLLAGRTHAKQ